MAAISPEHFAQHFAAECAFDYDEKPAPWTPHSIVRFTQVTAPLNKARVNSFIFISVGEATCLGHCPASG